MIENDNDSLLYLIDDTVPTPLMSIAQKINCKSSDLLDRFRQLEKQKKCKINSVNERFFTIQKIPKFSIKDYVFF